MDGYQRISAVIGLCAMALGVGLLAVPALATVGPFELIRQNISETGAEPVLLLTGTVVVSYLVLGLRRPAESPERSPEERRFDRTTARSRERSPSDRQRAAVADLDADIETAIEHGGEPLIVIKRELRRTVIGVYTDLYGATEQTASTAVAGGEWCDDPVANAFLATDGSQSRSLGAKIRPFVTPRRERRRRIERTITAIERLEGR